MVQNRYELKCSIMSRIISAFHLSIVIKSTYARGSSDFISGITFEMISPAHSNGLTFEEEHDSPWPCAFQRVLLVRPALH